MFNFADLLIMDRRARYGDLHSRGFCGPLRWKICVLTSCLLERGILGELLIGLVFA